MIRIGYQGIEGSNSRLAAERMAEKLGYKDVYYLPLVTSFGVKKGLIKGDIDLGVMALKNLCTGEIKETISVLEEIEYSIIEKITLPIKYSLYSLKENSELKIIASHNQVLNQCKNNIKTFYPSIKTQELEDSAIGAKYLKEGILGEFTGIICSEKIGEINNLHLVKSNIQDIEENSTEFIMIEKKETKVAVAGLGLIGGSIAKCFKGEKDFYVYGYDDVSLVEYMALEEKSIHEVLNEDNIKSCDIVIVGLYPQKSIDYMLNIIPKLKEGALIVDFVGVKEEIIKKIEDLALENKIRYVGAHPMAGLEKGGYEKSFKNLYKNANMILVPTKASTESDIDYLSNLFIRLGFGHIKICDAKTHDKIIAHTSQLAHVVSNSYVKSKLSDDTKGYCGGSYKDMTRIAPLNEKLWKELFLLNREALLEEIDTFLENIKEVREAIENNDEKILENLLKEGRLRREKIDEMNK